MCVCVWRQEDRFDPPTEIGSTPTTRSPISILIRPAPRLYRRDPISTTTGGCEDGRRPGRWNTVPHRFVCRRLGLVCGMSWSGKGDSELQLICFCCLLLSLIFGFMILLAWYSRRYNSVYYRRTGFLFPPFRRATVTRWTLKRKFSGIFLCCIGINATFHYFGPNDPTETYYFSKCKSKGMKKLLLFRLKVKS